ncbi:MAG: DUF805 domain-containing protein [Pseudomonadales bacterium]
MSGILAQLFVPSGRMRRRQFWLISLCAWLGFSILYAGLHSVTGRASTLVLYPVMLALLFAVCSRRYHDLDKSAWWLLLLAVPVLGPLWAFIELSFRKGRPGDNRFGPDPRHNNADYLVVAT